MRKTILLTLFIFALSLSVLGQDSPPPKRVIWTVDKGCAPKNFSENEIKAIRLSCDEIINDGEQVRIVKYNGLALAVIIADDGSYLLADVLVVNSTKNRILVDPTESYLFFWKTEEMKGNAEVFDPIPPDKIAAKIKSRAKWANFFNGLGASLQTTTATATSTTYGSYPSTTQTVITVPNRQAQNQAAIQNENRSSEAFYDSQMVNKTALKANTLFENQFINGLVYFKRKRTPLGVFSFKLDGIHFQFSFDSSKK